jgi:hypothetical protein
MIDRKRFVMYPEEKLGGECDQLRVVAVDIKSSGTGYTSGTLSIAWTNGCQKFWEVVYVRSGCCVMCVCVV